MMKMTASTKIDMLENENYKTPNIGQLTNHDLCSPSSDILNSEEMKEWESFNKYFSEDILYDIDISNELMSAKQLERDLLIKLKKTAQNLSDISHNTQHNDNQINFLLNRFKKSSKSKPHSLVDEFYQSKKHKMELNHSFSKGERITSSLVMEIFGDANDQTY